MCREQCFMRTIFTSFLMFILAIQLARAGGKMPSPDFSNYPHTQWLGTYFYYQTNAVWNAQQTNLLAVSAFPSGGTFALEYFVTESGRERDLRNVWNWAIQDTHSKQLSEIALKSLRSAIRDLPSESMSPPIDRLVVISFREGTNWVTRSYDSSALPNPMRQIYNIIGERFESKQSR